MSCFKCLRCVQDSIHFHFLIFSFGQSAIFLLGGSNKSVKPIPMLIRSGDVVVLSGPMREAYHAVPRILKISGDPLHTIEPLEYGLPEMCSCLDKSKCLDLWQLEHNMKTAMSSDASDYSTYLQTSRINMNVRQVLHPKASLEKRNTAT